jgi:DNA-binding response OmpR family regulator
MQALIVGGGDPEVFAIFSHLLRENGIAAHPCSQEATAVIQLSSRKFEAIVFDFDQLPNAAEILSTLPSPNKNAVVIAIASTTTNKEAASRVGASFVVSRPLMPTEVRQVLRTAYGRMLRDGQSYFRFSYELPVSIRRSSGTLVQCSSINLSHSGMAVVAPCAFLVGEEIKIAFAIPNTEIFVSADGKIIWDDKHGKAGIKFDCSSAAIQARYFDWLQDHFFMTRDVATAESAVPEQVEYAGKLVN